MRQCPERFDSQTTNPSPAAASFCHPARVSASGSSAAAGKPASHAAKKPLNSVNLTAPPPAQALIGSLRKHWVEPAGADSHLRETGLCETMVASQGRCYKVTITQAADGKVAGTLRVP